MPFPDDYRRSKHDPNVVEGKATQTGVEKGTNVERTRKYITGLRGDPKAKSAVVTLTEPKFVVEGSNPALNRSRNAGVTVQFTEHR